MGKTWVVIPMYNEGTVIGEVVADVRRTFPHVVCIDDGSSDDSVARARSAGAVVIEHPINLGQGAALQTGFDYALSDPTMTEVVSFDADGQHQVGDAVGMVAKLRAENLDAVIGSRFLDKRTKVSNAKRAVLRTAAWYTRVTTSMALTDAHNGLRVLSRNVLESVRITQNRMAHASELVDLLGGLKIPWAEYPTHIVYTEYSKGKGPFSIPSIFSLS
jgi:glycosyltransferase involved in cell wall biosynthesis